MRFAALLLVALALPAQESAQEKAKAFERAVVQELSDAG